MTGPKPCSFDDAANYRVWLLFDQSEDGMEATDDCSATDAAPGLKPLWSQPVIMSSCHYPRSVLSRHEGVQRDLGHDFIRCAACLMMPARLWTVTVVIVIKGAENGSGRYLISAISGRQSPPAKTLKTQNHRDKISSFLANSPADS